MNEEGLYKLMQQYQEESKQWRDDTKELLKEMSLDIKETKAQAQTTNGRVSKLEFWRDAIKWGLGAIVTFLLLILPMLRNWVRNDIKEIQKETIASEIDIALSEAIENYEFNITQ